jgi:hypothetical protein
MQPKPPLPVPSDSAGVEVSGADSDSGKVVKRLEKESIDRGGLLCPSSFDWGLLDGMSFISLSFIRFKAGFDRIRHERFHKNNNLGRD